MSDENNALIKAKADLFDTLVKAGAIKYDTWGEWKEIKEHIVVFPMQFISLPNNADFVKNVKMIFEKSDSKE